MKNSDLIVNLFNINRGFEILYLGFLDKEVLLDKKYITNIVYYTHENEILPILNQHKKKRVVIDITYLKQTIDLKLLNYNDYRVFFISKKNANNSIILNDASKSFLIQTKKELNTFYLLKVLLQVIPLNSKLIIKQSNIHGFGVFSLEKFKEESILFFLYGEEIDLTNKNIDDFNCEWNALSLNTLLIRESRTTYGFINHSNNPNCYIDFKNKCVKTLKKIEPNEELLLNYEKEPLPIDYLNSHGSTYL